MIQGQITEFRSSVFKFTKTVGALTIDDEMRLCLERRHALRRIWASYVRCQEALQLVILNFHAEERNGRNFNDLFMPELHGRLLPRDSFKKHRWIVAKLIELESLCRAIALSNSEVSHSQMDNSNTQRLVALKRSLYKVLSELAPTHKLFVKIIHAWPTSGAMDKSVTVAQEASFQNFQDIYRKSYYRLKKAEEEMVLANVRLVCTIAKRHVNRGLAFADLLQEGNIGLIKAIERYDYQRGCRFSTYATWWIKQSINRALSEQARTIRIPVHINETLNQITRISRILLQQGFRDPTCDEIGDKLGKSSHEISHILNINHEPCSLYATVGYGEETCLQELLADKTIELPDIQARKTEVRELVHRAMNLLTPKEKTVLSMRYGIGNYPESTLEEVGLNMGLTRERIRQIEVAALRKLRLSKKCSYLMYV